MASAACCTTCSAPPCRPARACSRAVTGRWIAGAAHGDRRASVPQVPGGTAIGDAVVAGPRAVTLEDIEHFAEFTGDTFYAHMDDEAAAANPSSTAAWPTAT